MLSKVLSRADRERAVPLVFRSLGEQLPRPALPDASGDGQWKEKVHDLEQRLAKEKREAFDAGRREGEQVSRAELEPVLGKLNRSAADLLTLRAEMRRRAERDTVRLALLIAQRVLHRELSVDENALAAVARVAFERMTRAESYRVTVHPRFADSVSSALSAGQSGRVHIDADPGCAPGTLVIHSSEGTIDASVQTQLEEITRGLTDRLAHSS